MKVRYLYWIKFRYTHSFEGEFTHGFYSKSKDIKAVTRTAKNYMKKHFIPAEIIEVSEPVIEIILK